MHGNISDYKAFLGPGEASLARAILVAGLVAGTLDLAAAFVSSYCFFGAGPAAVLRFIASGAFGPAAYSGGTPMALAGLGLHFAIAFVWTALFMHAARKAPALVRNLAAAAVGFGILVWLVMNFGVLPLSRVPPGRIHPLQAVLGMLYLVLFIALPNAIVARRFWAARVDNGARPAA